MPVLTPEQEVRIVDAQIAILSSIQNDTSIVVESETGGLNRDFQILPGNTKLAGETVHIVGFAPDARDSNLLRVVLWQSFEIAHQLYDPFDEKPYRGANIFSTPKTVAVIDRDLAVLLDKFWWLGIQYVVDVTSPERSELERIGNVIAYTVTLQLTVDITQSNLPPLP
jgi:hypothetical protein